MLGFFKRKEKKQTTLSEVEPRIRRLELEFENLSIELLDIKKKARKKLYQEVIGDIPKEKSEKDLNDDGFNEIRKLRHNI